jgi:phage-related baseplate assembly protein
MVLILTDSDLVGMEERLIDVAARSVIMRGKGIEGDTINIIATYAKEESADLKECKQPVTVVVLVAGDDNKTMVGASHKNDDGVRTRIQECRGNDTEFSKSNAA